MYVMLNVMLCEWFFGSHSKPLFIVTFPFVKVCLFGG